MTTTEPKVNTMTDDENGNGTGTGSEFEHIIGNRFYNHDIDESFTVVGVTEVGGDTVMALMQYDDGTFFDESIVDDPIADAAGWSEHGLLDERYTHLGPGPVIDHSCSKGDHEWFPDAYDLWDDIESVPIGVRNQYIKFTRCIRCGLSMTAAWDTGTEDLDTYPHEWADEEMG